MSLPTFVTERNLNEKEAKFKMGLIFPDTYASAMSGTTVSTLYSIINNTKNWHCERFVLPTIPTNTPLSISHNHSLLDMDLLGFSAQFENFYLTFAWMLKKANYPLSNTTRKKLQTYPPLIVGGPIIWANPFPLMEIVDGYILGDAERALPLLLEQFGELGKESLWQHPSFFQDLPGFWSPHFLEKKQLERLMGASTITFGDIGGSWKDKFDFVNLNTTLYPLAQIKTNLPASHPYAPMANDSFQLELGRGCNHKCSFCMISELLSPARYRSKEKLLEIVEEGTKRTNTSKVSIFGTNISDHPSLVDLCQVIVNSGYELSISSLRADKISSDLLSVLIEGGIKNITIAPETGDEELRFAIGKRISDDQIYQVTDLLFSMGIQTVKNFFLIGFPNETKEKRQKIVDMVIKQQQTAKKYSSEKKYVRADVNVVAPKWQTPLKDWLFYFLNDNRQDLKQSMNNIYTQLDLLHNVYPRKILFQHALSQTWLGHFEQSILFILNNLSAASHIELSKFGSFYLNQYAKILDENIIQHWNSFKESGYQIRHKIKATNIPDNKFTKKFQELHK